MWVEIIHSYLYYEEDSVILFVRMWVEICYISLFCMKQSCHPLREDVSWNYSVDMVAVRVTVILFVRMWVEILKNTVLIIVVAIWFFLWGGELKYLWSSFSASHEGVTIIHYLIWILNSIIEILEEIFTCVLRKNEQHLVVSPIFIWYLNVE